jgi:pimeloyl-ACP methyl ester carboxylesterase
VRVDEHTIEVAEAPLFYRSAGSGAAPVLYLHGSPTSSDDWPEFLERTGGLAPDLIGFGRSAKGGNLDYTLDGLADFVERFLAALGVHEVSLVAHDWGAAAGLVFAQRHPGRVNRIVLINALPLLDGFRWHRLARAWRRPVLGELVHGITNRRLLARELRHGTVTPEGWSDARITAVWEQFDQGTQRAILRLYRSSPSNVLATAGARLATLTMPALVVWGQADPHIPARFGRAFAQALPDAELLELADAGHWPWFDRPDVIDRVAGFLDAAAPSTRAG